jgi:hypothetical protein
MGARSSRHPLDGSGVDEKFLESGSKPSMSIYIATGSFDLPGPNVVFDALSDGRLITSDGTTVKIETNLKSRYFVELGVVKSGTPTFLKVSLDGSSASVGFWSDTNKKVYVFNTRDAGGVRSFEADNFDSEWVSQTQIAISAEPPSEKERAIVSVLDVSSGTVKTIVKNAGQASGGVTILDKTGTLFVGDGFAQDRKDSTGQIKAYTKVDWANALITGSPIDFDKEGTLVATILSADTLGFDKYGNLFIGGGDVEGVDKGYAAVIAKSAIDCALAGGPPITSQSPPGLLQRLDPSPADNFWLVFSNRVTGELYLKDYGKQKVYVFELT